MPPPLPAPFQQGNLDGLCGVYAIINAARLLAQRRRLPRAVWLELFEALTERLQDDGVLSDAVPHGIATRQLRGLLAHACTWLSTEHDIHLVTSRPFMKRRSVTFADAADELRERLVIDGDRRAVAILGTAEHWTVVRSVGGTHLNLYDSEGLHRWQLRRCRFHRQQALPFRSEHVIAKKGVIIVAEAASERG
jgi:hypothetical protein